MGAEVFFHESKGETVQEAFTSAVEEAKYDYGHSGYTGTIAEKQEFVLIDLPVGANPHKFANDLLDVDDKRIDDKWGPAGAIQMEPNRWLFFGWASS